MIILKEEEKKTIFEERDLLCLFFKLEAEENSERRHFVLDLIVAEGGEKNLISKRKRKRRVFNL